MSVDRQRCVVALVGNPNVGKTSLFNALTGARHRVGNYPGVTVERRSAKVPAGAFGLREGAAQIELVDLPGCYSLTPYSQDEAVAFDALTGAEQPDAVLVVIDASNLARNLYFALQVAELGLPILVALNMVDVAHSAGLAVDPEGLSAALGCPVLPCVARDGEGLEALVAAVSQAQVSTAGSAVGAPADGEPAGGPAEEPGLRIPAQLSAHVDSPARARFLLAAAATESLDLVGATAQQRAALDGLDLAEVFTQLQRDVVARYAAVETILARLRPAPAPGGAVDPRAVGHADATSLAPAMRRSAQADRVITHRVWGPLIFVGVMALVFQSIFTWADPAISAIESLVGLANHGVRAALGPGTLTDLLTEGVISGVGNVVVFVPQIGLLFLFIALLEDSGYMARAAFIIDRVMAKVGLNGRSFVPLLSGYACAIPAIMGTRAIRNFRDRLVTILMIPFVSCSARLPIYALVIGALFEADKAVLGPFTQGGLILLSMYLLSTLSALAVGALYRRTILKGPTPPLVLELPPYRLPRARSVAREVVDRCLAFLRDAGTIILASTIVLWGLLSYPKLGPADDADLNADLNADLGAQQSVSAIEHSYGGRLGKAMEPALEPIGQDWRIGIGLIGSFAAREVFVSTLGLVYGIEAADEDDAPLRERIATATDAAGEPRYTPLKGLALMVFFVYAAQCMSTLAVVRRETRSWRWPIFMFVSMTLLAYLASLLVYQGGRLLGFE